MKKYTVFLVLIIFAGIFSSCSNGSQQVEAPQVLTTVSEVDQQADIDSSAANIQASEYSAVINGSLTVEEAAGLVYMREEEKLAHDVYITLFEQWGIPIFQNIAASELTHTETVKTMLDKYGIPDPSDGNLFGQFSDHNLQALYDELVALGSVSLADALIVGTAVEEIDILDLEEVLVQTELTDIIQVYETLLFGSRNHLRSFVSIYEKQTGQVFQPQYLTLTAYEEIISVSFETGRGNGQGIGKGFGNSTSTPTN